MMPATQRSRKSIGTHSNSRKAIDKENATVDLGATSMKSRSKSLGPGGLDALKQGSGNRRAVWIIPVKDGAFYTANVPIVSSCPDKAAAIDSEADSVCATRNPSVEEERTIQ